MHLLKLIVSFEIWAHSVPENRRMKNKVAANKRQCTKSERGNQRNAQYTNKMQPKNKKLMFQDKENWICRAMYICDILMQVFQ